MHHLPASFTEVTCSLTFKGLGQKEEHILEKAFTSLVFDTPNLEHLELKSKNMCKVDVCVYDEYAGVLFSIGQASVCLIE